MRVIVAMALPSAWLKSRTPCLSHPGHKNVEKKKKKAEKAAGEEQKNDAAKNSAAEPQPGAEEAAGAEQENDAAKAWNRKGCWGGSMLPQSHRLEQNRLLVQSKRMTQKRLLQK